MSFGLNRAQVIGRLGADVTVHHFPNGGRVANLSVATDESYMDKTTGERHDRTEWHKVVTFQDGLIKMFEKHARKGRMVYLEGKLQTRKWHDQDKGVDRFSTEILLVPGGRVQFLGKMSAAQDADGVPETGADGQPPEAGDGAVPATDAIDDGIPF